MKIWFAAPLLLGLSLSGPAGAQSADPAAAENVAWTVSATPASALKPGSAVTLTLRAAVRDGWHVYGLQQLPDGPTPLVVKLDASEIASASGPAKGSPAVKFHDPAFNLDTQFYSKDFTVSVPLKLAAQAVAGAQTILLSVRFQTCNGAICQPPKTVHLAAPVNVQG